MISTVNSHSPDVVSAPRVTWICPTLSFVWLKKRVDKWVLIFHHSGDCHFCTVHLWTKFMSCLTSSGFTPRSSHRCSNRFWAGGTWRRVPSTGASLFLWAPPQEAPAGTSTARTPASPECARESMPQGQPSNDGRWEQVSKCSSPSSAQPPWFVRWPWWGSSPQLPVREMTSECIITNLSSFLGSFSLNLTPVFWEHFL